MPAIQRQRCGGRKLEMEQFATAHAPQIVRSGRCVGNLESPDTRSGRGYLARSDQGRLLSSLKSASRLAKGLTAAGVGITSTAIIGLYWN
jgi:hypothetical protein